MKIKIRNKEDVIKMHEEREQWHWYFAWHPITTIETEESSKRYFVWFGWVCRKFIYKQPVKYSSLVSHAVYKMPSVQAKHQQT